MGLKDKVAAQEAKNKASAKRAVKKQPKVQQEEQIQVPQVTNIVQKTTNLDSKDAAFILSLIHI